MPNNYVHKCLYIMALVLHTLIRLEYMFNIEGKFISF